MPYVGRTPSAVPVTADDIPANSIDASKIIDGAIAVADVADNAITEAKIADAAVVSLKSGRKNLIINGAMQVAQRGTSSTGLGDGDEGYVTIDRMRHTTNSASAGRFTSAQTAITDLAGFANCLHLDCTTADTSIAASEVLVLEHYIEGQDLQQFAKGTASAKDITVSFYMKTNKAFTFMCVLNDFDNNRVSPQQFTTTTTWTRHSITFAGDTTGTWDDDANRSLSVSIYLHAGSDHTGGTYSANTWQSRASSNNMIAVGIGSFYDSTSNDIKITGLQMELGSVATDFEHRSYGEELALCQRYYQNCLSLQLVSRANTSTRYRMNFAYPVVMRAAPTLTRTSNPFNFNGLGVGYSSTATTQAQAGTITASAFQQDFGGFTSLPNGAAIGQGSVIIFNLDAEL
jgi:hypothetical protein